MLTRKAAIHRLTRKAAIHRLKRLAFLARLSVKSTNQFEELLFHVGFKYIIFLICLSSLAWSDSGANQLTLELTTPEILR